MKIYLVKLKFTSGVHFGSDVPGIGIEATSPIFHSDSLFSAIINAWARVEQPKFFKNLPEDLPFIVSSTSFYQKDDYYVPKPLIMPADWENYKDRYGKDFKRIKYIRIDRLQKWLKGEHVVKEIIDEDKDIKFYTEDVQPRVQIGRLTSQSNLYHCGVTYFEEDCGLYFLVKIEDDWVDRFQVALEILSGMGLGGERTYGLGHFEVDVFQEIDKDHYPIWNKLLNEHNSSYLYLLSLYHPHQDEITNLSKAEAYELIMRKGWSFSTQSHQQFKRKAVRMLTEGSIIPYDKNKKWMGTLKDVTPNGYFVPNEKNKDEKGIKIPHPIYRYGFAFGIPFEMKGDKNA